MDQRMLLLCACAALEASGDLERLDPAIRQALDGTVIAIPAEVKHWHGAAKDSWFQHLTYHNDVQDGSSNEWLEPVTDEVYKKLK